jgi:predicted aspartyl protease
MTGRQAYITVKREKAEKLRLPSKGIVLVCLAGIFLFAVCSVLRNACEQTRDEFVEKLKNGKKIVETNKALKMELLAITQKGYVEFAAEERLGLKKPTEEEVVILK